MLDSEIERAQRLVKTDAYQLSLGEIVNMYRAGELIITPPFQRLFRWGVGQKSRLIESLLLGIPLPSIFVFERDDSVWELIDGLQRISTILEFIGVLKDDSTGQPKPPSALSASRYLPSLNNVVWQVSDQIVEVPTPQQIPLGTSHQLAIRRSRISVQILKRPSDNATKFDLFQRLNSGGTPANAQELRNCLIVMVNDNYHAFMKGLAGNHAFQSILGASDDQIERQRDMEYVSRFLVHVYVSYENRLDVEEYIDEGIARLASVGEVVRSGQTFIDTFSLLNEVAGGDTLRRMDPDGRRSGRVGLVAFEALAVGVGKNIANIRQKQDPVGYVRQRIGEFWLGGHGDRLSSGGQRGTSRIQRTIPFGENWFAT